MFDNKIKAWKQGLFFSLISYSLVLFVILVIDVFSRMDFDFGRAFTIVSAYMGLIIFLFFVTTIILSRKLTVA